MENDWLATLNPYSHNCLRRLLAPPIELWNMGPSYLASQCKFSFTAENAKVQYLN